MKINILELISGKVNTLDFEFDYLLKDKDILETYNIKVSTPFKVTGQVKKVSDKIFLDFSFRGIVTFICNRCLSEFKKDIEGIYSSEVINDEIHDEENERIIIVQNDIIDLSDILIESIILSLPMKAICDDNCQGLCSICGLNLNNNDCSCNRDSIDPRLEKLKQFFVDDEEV